MVQKKTLLGFCVDGARGFLETGVEPGHSDFPFGGLMLASLATLIATGLHCRFLELVEGRAFKANQNSLEETCH